MQSIQISVYSQEKKNKTKTFQSLKIIVLLAGAFGNSTIWVLDA